MKEFNFNTLQNLPVPENWIENALAIPGTETNKPAPVPFWRKPRFVAMAATLVLVSALSIALSLTMGRPPVSVKPDGTLSATEIIWSTDEYGATVATEVVVVPDGSTDQSGASPTEAKSVITRMIERLFGTESNPSPTTAPGSGRGGRTNPTVKPSPTGGDTPSLSPTEPAVEKPTATPTEDDGVIPNGPGGWDYEKPTLAPQPYSTTAPTESPWAYPTEQAWAPYPTEPGWHPRPTDPPKPTQSPYKASISITVSNFTVSSINNDGGVVYCRIYDSSGNSYGDSDLYSAQHLASLSVGSRRTLSYSPRDYGILPEDGYYSYEFYTRSGKSLVSGNAYLSAS